ncbi:MAG: hypothetical protein AAFQ09_12000 [Pseudomonadota bacterium]
MVIHSDKLNTIPLQVNAELGRMVVGSDAATQKAHILHCNYYNTYLQRTIWQDAGKFFDTAPILVGAAAEQARVQLSGLFADQGLKEVERRKVFASNFYSWQGFGTIDLTNLGPQGRTVPTAKQHYVEGWKTQFGLAKSPVGLMTQGWLSGAADAIFDLDPGTLKPCQTECGAVTGADKSVFVLSTEGPDFPIYNTGGIGTTLGGSAPASIGHNIDNAAVAQAVLGLPLFGDAIKTNGLVESFGVLISWHPHQYYDRISFETVHKAVELYGDEGRILTEPLLEEAGHRCAFRTFGGIWRSQEWAAVVEPMCKTQEDWVHGMLAIINCAGWGKVSCTKLTPDEAEFVVVDDYESVGYTHLYGKPDFAPTYLFKGGFRGIMNLIYNGGMMQKPALSEDFYNALITRHDAFEVEVVECQAQGAAQSTFRVVRKG